MKRTPFKLALLLLSLLAAPIAHGAVLNDCQRSGKKPVQISSCLREEQIKAEASLNIATVQARRQTKGNPQALHDFDERHQAWQIHRSRECRRRFDSAPPGSAAGDVRMACEIELTRQRLADIARRGL